MTVLVTSDTHFTSNPRDANRWGLFSWLRKQVKKTGAKQVLFLGDLTDAKDRHPSELVNKLVAEMVALAELAQVIILRGNHDYIDIDNPFFRFLDSTHHNIVFVREPTVFALDDGTHDGGRTQREALFLPNTRDYAKDWAGIDLKGMKYVFTHQTYAGSLTENGTKLDGVPADFFAGFKGQVWSGDIHVPQRIGANIQYVGAPYRCHFGDTYTPRVVLLKHGKSEDLHFPTVAKELVTLRRIEKLKGYDFPEGSQVKVRMELHRGDFPMWKDYKRTIVEYATKHAWELYGPELVALPDDRTPDDENEAVMSGAVRKPAQVLRAYAHEKELDKELVAVGLTLLKEA